MNDRKQIMGTYKSISDWHNFRLRLFLEGILTGIFAGMVISLFRWGLTVAEEWRVDFYKELMQSYLNAVKVLQSTLSRYSVEEQDAFDQWLQENQ